VCQVRAVRRMSHQFDVLAGQTSAGLSWFVRVIVMVHNDPSFLVRFSDFSEDFRQTNCGVPQTNDHLLRSVFSTNNFRCPCQGLLGSSSFLFCFGLISIDPWLVTCDDLKNVFGNSAFIFFQNFFLSLSQGMSHDDLSLSAHARHQCSPAQRLFFTTTFVFEPASATIEFIKPVFHSAIGCCFIAVQRFKFIEFLSWQSTSKVAKNYCTKMFTR